MLNKINKPDLVQNRDPSTIAQDETEGLLGRLAEVRAIGS
jgi:hypothetical protein